LIGSLRSWWNVVAARRLAKGNGAGSTLRVQFDHFELDEEQKSVRGPDGPIALRAQTYAVLCYLIKRAPAVVSRDELLDAVWGHQATSVSSVAQTIKELRQALGDSSTEPRLIATRRRFGYQFLADVCRPVEQSAAAAPAPAISHEIPVKPQAGWFWGVLAALLLLAVVATSWSGRHGQPTAVETRQPTLAVAQMVNASDDPELDWIGPALETYLGHALVELGGFRVVVVDPLDRADETQLGHIDYFVEGRYLSAGFDGTRLLTGLRRPGSSEILASLESGLSQWDVAALSIDMATAIRERLGFSAPPGADSAAIRARLPRLPVAQRAYFEASEQLHLDRPRQALAHISQARLDQPVSPRLDHLEALAWMRLGDWKQARTLSERSLATSQLWPRRDRLDLEATAAMLAFDFERAADSLQALTQFYPEPDTSRRLVEALMRAGRLRAAHEALDSLRLQRPRDPRLALLAAQLAQAEAKHEQHLEAARDTLQLASEGGLDSLRPSALLSEAGALTELGRLVEAHEVLKQLLLLGDWVGDPDVALAHLAIARVRFQQGELSSALESVELALGLFEAIPHPAGQAESLMVAGAIHDRSGRLEAALDVLEQATSYYAELGDQRRLARSLVQRGISLMRANQTELAMELFDRGARQFRALGDRQGEGATLVNHGMLLARGGRMLDAEPLFERALEAFVDAGDLRGQAMALGNLAGIAGERRDWSRSIEWAEQSLVLFEQLGAQTDIARVSYNLGVQHRRRGELDQAERRIEQAAAAFASQGATLMKARVLTTLGAMLVSSGRLAELDAVLGRVDALDIEDEAELAVYHAVIGERALAQQDLALAREHFLLSEALLGDAGSGHQLWIGKLNLARLDLAEGHPVRAEQAARDLLPRFAEVRASNRQVDALMLLAGSLIGQQRLDDASAAISRAEDLLDTSPDSEQSLKLALLRSQVSDPTLAAQRLEWVAEVASQQGFGPLLDQARGLQAGLQP